MNFSDYVAIQMKFSRDTFGPGERSTGVSRHIIKELDEIQNAEFKGQNRSEEWVDVAILAIDGMWRALEAEGKSPVLIPEIISNMLIDKQKINMGREWPDYREVAEDEPIEHVKR